MLEALVRAGAFDGLSRTASRSVLMASLDDAMKSAGRSSGNTESGILTSLVMSSKSKPPMPTLMSVMRTYAIDA